jgi:hypothetical protein
MSEAGASLVDQKLGLGVVPKTKVNAYFRNCPQFNASRHCLISQGGIPGE